MHVLAREFFKDFKLHSSFGLVQFRSTDVFDLKNSLNANCTRNHTITSRYKTLYAPFNMVVVYCFTSGNATVRADTLELFQSVYNQIRNQLGTHNPKSFSQFPKTQNLRLHEHAWIG